jgi:hypothetical protein
MPIVLSLDFGFDIIDGVRGFIFKNDGQRMFQKWDDRKGEFPLLVTILTKICIASR